MRRKLPARVQGIERDQLHQAVLTGQELSDCLGINLACAQLLGCEEPHLLGGIRIVCYREKLIRLLPGEFFGWAESQNLTELVDHASELAALEKNVSSADLLGDFPVVFGFLDHEAFERVGPGGPHDSRSSGAAPFVVRGVDGILNQRRVLDGK